MVAPVPVCASGFIFVVAAVVAGRGQAEHEKRRVYFGYQCVGPDLAELVDLGVLGEQPVFAGGRAGVHIPEPLAAAALSVGDGLFAGGVVVLGNAAII